MGTAPSSQQRSLTLALVLTYTLTITHDPSPLTHDPSPLTHHSSPLTIMGGPTNPASRSPHRDPGESHLRARPCRVWQKLPAPRSAE